MLDIRQTSTAARRELRTQPVATTRLNKRKPQLIDEHENTPTYTELTTTTDRWTITVRQFRLVSAQQRV